MAVSTDMAPAQAFATAAVAAARGVRTASRLVRRTAG